MKIIDLLNSGHTTISCELFPPKKGEDLPQAQEVVKQISALHPAFMSVTYGAGGGTSATTVRIAQEIQKSHVPALAHLTCVSSTRDEISERLAGLKKAGIENILALRGDIPEGKDFPTPNQYHYASELIREIKTQGDFCIGGACYPEGHVECAHKTEDIRHLHEKVEAGCDFLTSQMFFDNDLFYNFMFRALAGGVNVPIIAGIMPVTNAKQITRICSLSGTILPQRFKAIADRFGSDPKAMKQAGIAYATEQIINLISNGVPHIHIYTMNKPDIAAAIFHNLSDVISCDGN
ncbi:methylenetetrahydrofolate reductase [NAD(P)H] [Caproicibacterium sp. BJN0003]|uniref:methylenetetrahydrofolate reductase [NAD(P)H] n=1 Tax=Caproicibacterium sp. BJN0003 TaxID=2994078 RepID=UPI00225ABEF6|nr:methylenetetrahydrofolate reductase [NAD(P)H] [Caproicibacterium sp. BJN0003]UZT82992.1 methylenetetrahydrofolate reductase [NAD(P)H] [Caproicibacterium sp. BJN0003]